ncbi:MAG: hypothetical protein Q8916_13115, partial [Bacteroidota bacterium]|nr:hypothetical protein [Bacteroidota bacterium]
RRSDVFHSVVSTLTKSYQKKDDEVIQRNFRINDSEEVEAQQALKKIVIGSRASARRSNPLRV